jgi:sortase A
LGLILTLFILSFSFTPARPALASEPATPLSAQLIIPSIGLNSAVVPVGLRYLQINGQTYGQWLVDQNLVGWHNLSARPGQAGNTVLNGHSNIYGQVFRHLPEVSVGDEIILSSSDQSDHYVITHKLLVLEKGASLQQRLENAKLAMPTPDERLTLITCAGPGAVYRLIVIAQPVVP